MKLLPTLVGLIWLVFALVWLISSFYAKRSARRWPRFLLTRVALIVMVVILVRDSARSPIGALIPAGSFALAVVGVVLCFLGIALAFWARFFIGRNWGMPMSRKEEPELVTAGPYRYIRHPIYSGVLLAMIGTALVMGLPWFILAAVMAAYFVWSATVEERYLLSQFPDAYAAYRARSRMLIPFLL